jgi:hypothetical protein
VIDNDVGIMSGVFLDSISDFQTNIDGVAIIYQNDGAFFVRLLQAVFESSFEILGLESEKCQESIGCFLLIHNQTLNSVIV